MGNHDYKKDYKYLTEILIKNDIKILINEMSTEINNLEIIGLHDYYHEFHDFKN